MRIRWSIITAAAAAATFALPQFAQAQALVGQVSSAKEGAMEGVVVTARKAGAKLSISVVTDAQGRYSFPADRLEAGQYALTIRAIGYDLSGKPTADVATAKTATATSFRARAPASICVPPSSH